MDDGSVEKKRYKMLIKLVSLRKQVPKTLVKVDTKIQKIELAKLKSTKGSLEAVQDQLTSYVQKISSCEEKRVPNFRAELKAVKILFNNFDELNRVFEDEKKNRIDPHTFVKKAEEIRERMLHFKVAQRQLESENPLIIEARYEAWKLEMMRKQNMKETEDCHTSTCENL